METIQYQNGLFFFTGGYFKGHIKWAIPHQAGEKKDDGEDSQYNGRRSGNELQ
jgi:hypothetical protein